MYKSCAVSVFAHQQSEWAATITKNEKEKTLFYKKSWIEERSWHVYSPELNGGLCEMCVLFDKPHKKAQRGAFVATAKR